MAKRDALRQLQARLADRLQAVQSEAQRSAWLAVECEGRGLLLPLASAGEIFAVPQLLPVPHTLPWFAGVANLRGGLHGVVDFAAFLGLRGPHPSGEPWREQARVLALNPRLGSHSALLVDRLAGLRAASQMAPGPATEEERPPFAGALWHDSAGREWQEINLAALANDPTFLGISH
jgi:twitching motility protein PilI